MNKERIKYLYKLAFTDLLTGFKNRNAYEEKLKVYIRQPELLKGDSVVVIDIDGLKQINDTYGHHSGDEAIRTIGDGIIKSFSNKNFCCRNGGDEFALFMAIYPKRF
ncbi:MAG: GGDEF domain-containing protein [Eubacteriales bacterium]|nr:GGDEF domain-containing protein [Eubacteriales bacterium]